MSQSVLCDPCGRPVVPTGFGRCAVCGHELPVVARASRVDAHTLRRFAFAGALFGLWALLFTPYRSLAAVAFGFLVVAYKLSRPSNAERLIQTVDASL